MRDDSNPSDRQLTPRRWDIVDTSRAKSENGLELLNALRQVPKGRVVEFPGDHDIGAAAFLGIPGAERPSWEFLAIAHGRITVPAGRWLGLSIYSSEPDYDALQRLKPDDLQGISGSAAMLPFIRHLSGLRQVQIRLDGDKPPNRAALDLIWTMSAIEDLGVSCSGVGPDWYEPISGWLDSIRSLPNLRRLYFTWSPLCLDDLACLQTNNLLKEILINEAGTLTDAAVANLAKLKNLRGLLLDWISYDGYLPPEGRIDAVNAILETALPQCGLDWYPTAYGWIDP
jgi:hypothetical protein